MSEAKKPKINSESEKELVKVQEQFDEFDRQIKEMTQDRMNMAPQQETEPQAKLSQKEIEKSNQLYLKPKRTYPSKEKFNERFRDEYNFQREYVNFIAQNEEIIGEDIKLSLKKFPGTPVEDWDIPVNKPVWAPRMVAERISECKYHRLVMQDRPTTSEGGMQYYGSMAVDTTKNRLDAKPVSTRKSLFMGNTF